ncbi:unnamed protein product [Cylicocyclus nassatus]|uniref:Uncharacterized protein n=1 Tax=Cylicocyclus nassatus TaxID=53992 RepID=A0AA36M6H9_CYLNA|nr:unnamed protein product [Cylicocyclus nassatus]
MFIWILILITASLSDAVSLRLVRIACERDPTLHFCDSHILGDPVTSTKKPVESTTLFVRTNGKVPGLNSEEQEQFFTWLTDFRDEVVVADPEIDTEELETQHRQHKNRAVYCNKYRANFDHYCKDSDVEKLEGVLPQFCSMYGRHCGIDEDDFPTPAPLLGSKQQIKAEIAPIAQAAATDSPDDYCKKFADQYGQLCGASKSGSEDFCKSYKKACEKSDKSSSPPEESSTSSNPPEKSSNSSSPGESSSASKEIDELEPPPENEAGGKAPPTTKEPMRDAAKSAKLARYCDKYWDNFNYFCAGENSEEHENFCHSYRTNCPEKGDSEDAEDDGEGGIGGLGGGDDDDEGGGRSSSNPSLYHFKGTRKGYCDKFSVNYEYYCRGESDNPKITAKFCPSYKKACKDQPPVPANPFTKAESGAAPEDGPNSANFPDLENPGKTSKIHSKVKKAEKLRPCTADCDRRLFPHCTDSCKCDYAFPAVQRFCNPPPLPFFLNTCRLWYSGCPKYEQYHYASQFIYSKAEKGKKVELPQSSKPFSVLSPNGERIPVVVKQPGGGNVARDETPSDTVRWDSPISLDPEDFEPVHERKSKNATTVQQASASLTNNHNDKVEWYTKENENVEWYTKENQTLKDDPGKGATPTEREKDVPIVPSDSVFSNALQQYGSFTDTRGILHRPRSRSPFTKPGLWEANPDNPHNRDHANKWYYAPRSVNVDWLSGQLAWGAHWAVPAASVGGTDGFSAVHFPTIGTFANIPDDYD